MKIKINSNKNTLFVFLFQDHVSLCQHDNFRFIKHLKF